jgi:TonB-dependent starch-binding outer membrane protein SusC
MVPSGSLTLPSSDQINTHLYAKTITKPKNLIMKEVYRSSTKVVFAMLFLLATTLGAFAQERMISGKIVDNTGAAMPGVNVLKKGTTVGTASDANGEFSLAVQNDDILVISFIGYRSQEVLVGTQTRLEIKIEEDFETLDEVVVVGYGEMRKADVISAQSSISTKDIERTVNTTIDQAIQGRAAGVFVTQNTGAPGGGISVNIRGINTISGSNEPLYVIDGVQVQGSSSSSGSNPLASLNPADIAGIEILQGPSATAIYGSRATNGVVLITTKRGKSGEVKISYGYSYALQTAPKPIDIMDMREYAQMEIDYKAIAGGDVREEFLDPSILGAGTNWQRELFDNAAMHKHQLSLSGGSDKLTYYLSGERLLQDGVALGSGFERTSVRLNVDNSPRKWFKIGANVNFAQTDEDLATSDINGDNLIVNAIRLAPYIPVKNLDGSFGGGNPQVGAEQFAPVNPVAIASMATNELTRRRMLGGLNVAFKIVEGLEVRTDFNTDINYSNSVFFLPTYALGWQRNDNARLENRDGINTYWGWSQTVQYNKKFGANSSINAMVTHEAQKSTWRGLFGSRTGFITNEVLDLNAGDPTTAGNSGGHGTWAMESYLGRINYNYGDRYLLTGAFRADGSVNFGPGNKWGYFPSLSVAWRVSEEAFFSGVDFVNDLRVRFETGLTGNQGNGAAIYARMAQPLPTDLGLGLRPGNYANKEYQWEETQTNNFGFTVGLFDNRIQLDADYYIKNTDNLILQSELPWTVGTDGNAAIGAPTVNVGSLENRGWSFSINTINMDRGGFRWTSNLNLSSFETKITGLTENTTHITRQGEPWFLQNMAQRSVEGRAPWLFFGYVEEGIFQSREEIENSALPVGSDGNELPIAADQVWVGDVKYKDVDGDGKITAGDMTFIGNPWPKLFGGLTNTFSYKGIELSILITGNYGNDVYNYLHLQNSNPNNINLGQNMFKDAIDFARVANDENGNPYLLNPGTNVARVASSSVNGNYNRLTNKYLEDGSYLRVKNISINYSLPQTLVSKTKFVNSARVGFSVQNVFTLTNYSGYDPEIGSYVGPNAQVAGGFVGVDYGRYPLTPVYSFNVGIDF